MAGRLKVTREDENGRNTHFQDTRTKQEMTLAQAIKKVDSGAYPDYHTRGKGREKYIASNPNGKTKDNLG